MKDKNIFAVTKRLRYPKGREQYELKMSSGWIFINYFTWEILNSYLCFRMFRKAIMCKKCKASFFFSNIHTHTYEQTCSSSLQPWEWRILRFKVISSIQQPGALHCQCTTSFRSHIHSDAHTHCWLVYIPHTTSICVEGSRCLSGENTTLGHFISSLTHIHTSC